MLLNLSGGSGPGPAFPGEEPIPDAYRSVELSAGLKAIRAVLFGQRPDRAYLNYRVFQYLTLLHSTELVGHVLALDPRITYTLGRDPFPDAGNSYEGPLPLYFAGSRRIDDQLGRALTTWRISFDLPNSITVVHETFPVTESSGSVVVADGLAGPVALDRGLSVSVTAQESVWHVRSLLRPERTLDQVLTDLQSSLVESTLFGVVPVEPYATYRALWRDNAFLAYRLGGAVMALIQRTEDARRKET